jgi:hypothetical protein
MTETSGASDDDLVGTLTRADGCIGGGLAAAVLILGAIYGAGGYGRPLSVGVLVVAMLVRLYWPIRDRLWFRIVIASIAAFHVAMAVLYPWGEYRMSGRELTAIATLDLFAFGLLVWIMARKILGPFKP